VDALMRGLRSEGYAVTLTSAWRSHQDQRRLFRLHQDHPELQRLPVAPPGCSTHEYGYAVDLVTDYPDLEELGRAFGFAWAGPSDPVHFDVFGSAWRGVLRRAGHVC
jgi:LAS superfamily LD-carboxypeptidase LdcB